EPGVVGYTVAQQEDDARSGWYGGSLNPADPNGANAVSRAAVMHTNNIFAQPDAQAATLTLNPVVDGTSNASGIRSENSGTIWSRLACTAARPSPGSSAPRRSGS